MNQRGKMIAEFFLIVIGVLVALMVETALEDRQDENLRDEYISRIRVDIESDKRAIEYRIEFFVAVKQFSRATLDWLESDVSVDQESLLASFYAAEIWPLITNLSTYQDLHSTGNLRLLKDIDLRTSLAAYYNKADSSRPGWNPSTDYREIVRGIIPSEIQDLIRENCPTTDAFDQLPTGFPPCALNDIDYVSLTALFEPLREDAAFRQKLTYRDSELGVVIYLLRQQAAYADDVLARIMNL